MECNGGGPALPVSLVQMFMGAAGGIDTYSVSYAKGFNIPITVRKILR
jgi:hypothetical protein